MIFGIGVLMVVAAFRPWLRFETMVFSAIEKSFMVYLFLANLGQSWAMGYLFPFVVDLTIVAYSIMYFISDQGRPQRWIVTSQVPIKAGGLARRQPGQGSGYRVSE